MYQVHDKQLIQVIKRERDSYILRKQGNLELQDVQIILGKQGNLKLQNLQKKIARLFSPNIGGGGHIHPHCYILYKKIFCIFHNLY